MQLRNPTQEPMPFWETIGLDVKTPRTAPLDVIMRKLQDAVVKRGGLRRMTTGDILGMEEGIEPKNMGGGISLLMDLFGRIESRRAAIVTLSQLINPPTEGAETYAQLLEFFKGSTAEANNLNKAVERALDRKRIQQAGIALRNMFTEALNPFERRIAGIASGVADVARGPGPEIAQGVGAGIAAYGAYRLGRFGKAGIAGIGRYARGLGPAGIAITQAGQMPTGAFANPFWVIIHPLSNVPG